MFFFSALPFQKKIFFWKKKFKFSGEKKVLLFLKIKNPPLAEGGGLSQV